MRTVRKVPIQCVRRGPLPGHCDRVAESEDGVAEPLGFDDWYHAMTSRGEVDPDRTDGIRRWFLDL